MKLKLNLNVDSVKRVLMQHGEKAAFGLAVCVLLLFFWKTLRMEVLGADKQPEMLTKLADQTKAHVLASKWDPVAKDIEIVDYPTRAEHVALLDDNYRLKVFFDKPLWEQHEKRSAPKVWPVEELLAASGQGIFAIKRESGDDVAADTETRPVADSSTPKGHRAKLSKDVAPKGFFYVAITGLVPMRKQTAEYYDAFRGAQKYDPARDVPVYEHEHMKIERAEVTGANLNKIAWQEIDLAAVDNFVGKWPADPIDDVVDAQYVDDACTMPLGPLLGEDWDPVKAGHPKIPPAERLDQSTKKPEKETPEPAGGTRKGWGKDKSGTKPGSEPIKPSTPEPIAKGGTVSPKPDQKLFRFVDYTVKPGKQYRYRVKLALNNPNQGLPDQYLKDPALARTPTLETDWSEPSPPVVVPRGFKVFAGPILKLNQGSPPDPEVEVCVVSFDQKQGGEPAVKDKVYRGSLLNFTSKEDVWVLMADHSAASNWGKVEIRSNALVVDVQGGRKFSAGRAPLIEPVEMLILDADGHAMVHDELDDSDEYHARLDHDSTKQSKESGAKEKDDPADMKNPYDNGPKSRGGGKPGKSPKTPVSKATTATTRN